MSDRVDMAQFVEAKSDQLNADDLIGAPRTITVRKVTGNDGDQPVSIYYEGDNNKPFKPCKTIRRVLMGVWGRYANDYVGKSMTLYRDDKVTFGGLETGGIRISHMSHIDKETMVVVMKSKGKKAPFKVLPLKDNGQGSTGQTDRAAAWAQDYAARIDEALAMGDIDAFVSSKAAKLEELRGKRPELAEQCDAAVQRRLAELNDTARRTDTDHGDQFGGEGASEDF